MARRTTVMSPQTFLLRSEREAERALQRVLKVAKKKSDSEFTLTMNLSPGAFQYLVALVKNEGFSDIVFVPDSRDGHYYQVVGNPFAKQHAEQQAAKYVQQINEKLKHAREQNGELWIAIQVPAELQSAVLLALGRDGWTAEFGSDGEGSYIKLFV